MSSSLYSRLVCKCVIFYIHFCLSVVVVFLSLNFFEGAGGGISHVDEFCFDSMSEGVNSVTVRGDSL